MAVRKHGFAPVTLWFPTPLREAEVPASYTQTIYPTETIGGVVRDEQGRPVAGVRVAPTIWTSSAEIRYLHEDFQERLPRRPTLRVDGSAGMPAGIDRSRVSIAFTHPDYERVNWPIGQALDDVHRGKATVLPRGLDLAGRVVDPMGRPIAGAGRPGIGSDRARQPRVETDADGRFRFTHRPAGETVLTVQTPRVRARLEGDRRAPGPPAARVPPPEGPDGSGPRGRRQGPAAGRGDRGRRRLARASDSRLADDDRRRRRIPVDRRPAGCVLDRHLARGLSPDLSPRGSAGRRRADDRDGPAVEGARDGRRCREPPCDQVVHRGAGDGERRTASRLTGIAARPGWPGEAVTRSSSTT